MVVHCKKSKFDVYIGRPSKWGNPFEIGKDGSRDEVIKKYHDWILTQPHLLNDLHELKGKVLACWCAPKACHGDILEKLAKEYILMTPIVTTEKVSDPLPPLFHQLRPGTYFTKDNKWTSVIYKKKYKIISDESNALIVSHHDPEFIGMHDIIKPETEVFPLTSLEIKVKYSI